jgi:peptidoglycan/LPS O-acetylase OafA/YrhL
MTAVEGTATVEAVVPPPAASATGSRHRISGHRAAVGRIVEIDGLRAIALTLVVAFHLFGRGRVSGGVDVFLFVSGVVLALSLEASVARGEQAAVFHRWGRTFARLAPPAALVLLAVVGMSLTILPPWLRDQNLVEVASAALYVENWQLIASQLAYGAAGPATSPVQHFWSLSIQGQLLIAIPLVVAAVYGLRRLFPRPGVILWTSAAAATAASFVYALVVQQRDSEAAYFDTFARLWELGAGLLIGLAVGRGISLSRRWAGVLGWAGLAAVLSSGLLVDGAHAYPGPAALVPVGGAALVVLSFQAARSGPGPVLRSPAFASFSNVSYSLYLWHWPVLIAFLALAHRDDGVVGWRGAVVVLTVSVALAIATWWALERPLARRLAVAGSRGRVATAVASVAIVVCAVLGSLFVTQSAPQAPAASADTAVVQCGSSAGAAGVVDGCAPQSVPASCLGAASLDPLHTECARVFELSSPPVPAFDRLRADDDNRQDCWASRAEYARAVCSVGPSAGYTLHLLAVGDSHNNTLLGAYEKIALDKGWRIDIAGRPQCHWTQAVRVQRSPQNVTGCAAWNAFIDDYVATTDLDAIIVTNSSRAEYTVPAGESVAEARAQGFADAWAKRSDPAVPIIAIRDNPIFPEDSLTCILDLDRVRAGECSMPRSGALLADGLADAVAISPNAHLIDLTDYMCDPDRCQMVVGGVVVTRDGGHLTATFARTLTPYLEQQISAILGR